VWLNQILEFKSLDMSLLLFSVNCHVSFLQLCLRYIVKILTQNFREI
jgi:hypothetical protein